MNGSELPDLALRHLSLRSIDRRSFVQLSTGALLAAAAPRLLADSAPPLITNAADDLSVHTSAYAFQYTAKDDTFRIKDLQGRLIVSGKMQPAIVVAPADQPTQRICTPGKSLPPAVKDNSVLFSYESVNTSARISLPWRFDEHCIWTDPIRYQAMSGSVHDVISLHYFSTVSENHPIPSLHSSHIVVPGISEGSSVSPIVRDAVHLDESVWLGRGSFIPGLNQQWGLPVHYFSGFTADSSNGQRNMYTSLKSDAYTCGIATLPAGDLFIQLYEGSSAPWIDYRSDLWHHVRTPGPLNPGIEIGATLCWSFAPTYYQSIAAYYQSLLQAGIIHLHKNSPRKTANTLTPQFCTWGAQVTRHQTGPLLDEENLNTIYSEFKASGLKSGLFSIDDKWEGTYGNLEHDSKRFPHFEQFLDRIRADGYHIGLWAAVMRCERPSDLGLTTDNMLQRPDGKPYLTLFSGANYYILDFTQPAVAKVLGDLARRFMRRYKPDLLKFDFGYELPAVGEAAPANKKFSGERLLLEGLKVVIPAMREINPDLVVMYYNLSPLFLDYFDLHSTDDLFMAAGEYEIEANRRLYFSSLLGPLGVPTYGSSGYDWASDASIWFDSAAIGTLGSLNDFQSDERGEGPTPGLIARYNGLASILRPTTTFEIQPLHTIEEGPTTGAHARSWARFENSNLVLLALRPLIPGEPNLLEAPINDPRIKDVLKCSVPVVVASRTSGSIDTTSSLALVPCGPGEIIIRRNQGTSASITSHYLGGATLQSTVPITANQLRITPILLHSSGKPLEYLEIKIS